jgi:CubicO group peptidase (beta-lactamase class C family)
MMMETGMLKIGRAIAIITGAGLLMAFLTLTQARAASRDLRVKQIDAIFTGLISNDEPGAAVLAVKDGEIVFERGYGITDLGARHKIDAQTNFRLASVTKQFTAMAIMLLAHDGHLRYDQPLVDIFPGFPEYGSFITIRHLLNHTSGLLDYEDLMPKVEANTPMEQVQIKDAAVLELLKQQNSTKFAPGTRWGYSNSGYVLLGLIVEQVSGLPFGQFLHDRIFVPLKMIHTVAYERGKNEVSNRAFGHTKGAAGWQQTDQSPTSATLGDGGVYSSLVDLAKWDKALRDHTLLSNDEMQPALIPVQVPEGGVTQPDGTPAEYGFGWFLNPYRGHARMWHYGETAGFRTSIQRFLDDRLTIIVLCNRTDIEARELALNVADLYLEGTR